MFLLLGLSPLVWLTQTSQILDKTHLLSTPPFSSICDKPANSSSLFQMAEYCVNLCPGQGKVVSYTTFWSRICSGCFSLDPVWLVKESTFLWVFSLIIVPGQAGSDAVLVPLHFCCYIMDLKEELLGNESRDKVLLLNSLATGASSPFVTRVVAWLISCLKAIATSFPCLC